MTDSQLRVGVSGELKDNVNTELHISVQITALSLYLFTVLITATLSNTDIKPFWQRTYTQAYTHNMSSTAEWLGTNPADVHLQRE